MRSPPARSRWTARPSTSTTTSGSSATTRSAWSSTRRTTSGRSWSWSAAGRYGRCCAPTPTTTMSGWRRRSGAAVGAPVLLHPADLPLWSQTHDAPPDGELADGQEIEVAGTTLTVLHTPGPRAGGGVLLRRGPGHRVHRGHPVQRRAGCDGTQLQRPRRCWSPASSTSCWPCPGRPSSRPATGTTPPSPTRRTTSSEPRAPTDRTLVEPGLQHGSAPATEGA